MMKFKKRIFVTVCTALVGCLLACSSCDLFTPQPSTEPSPESSEQPIPSSGKIDEFEKLLVSTTTACTFTQETYNEDMNNVKTGDSSIKLTYGGKAYNGKSLLANGGRALLIPDNEQQDVYDDFSAYNAETDTYKSATGEKTYAGFWVRNTTGKQLEVCLNLRLYYPSGTGYEVISYGMPDLTCVAKKEANKNNTKTLELAAENREWNYYELELTELPDDLYDKHKVRMAIATRIEKAAAGDAFYIDGFDIYHGSRKDA